MAELITDHIGFLSTGHIVNLGVEYTPARSADSPKPERNDGGSEVAFWGENNDFPQQLIERAAVDTELPALLDWKGRALQGREVVAMSMEWDAIKKDFIPVRINDQEINDFLQSIFFKRYWREAGVDFVWFANIFPDMVKSMDGNLIAYLGVHKAEWCRWKKQDKTGVISECYVGPEWPMSKPNDGYTMSHPVIDPYDPDVVERVKEGKIERFVYPVSYPTPGANYYPRAPWAQFVFSEWYELKQLIAKMKVQLQKKLFAAKWTISIPVQYWETIYPDWSDYKPEKKRDLKLKKLKEVEGSLTGAENAGKLILCEVGKDSAGNELPAWKIEPIVDNKQGGENLEDSREASQHLMRGTQTDPTLVGESPGKTGAGGGSGSDKRIAFNMYVALLQPYRDVLLEPLYFIAKYNGWLERFPNLRFKVLEVELETLDKGKTTSERIS